MTNKCCHIGCTGKPEWVVLGKSYCAGHKHEGVEILNRAKQLRRQADELDGGLKCPACDNGWVGCGGVRSSCDVCCGEGRLRQKD